MRYFLNQDVENESSELLLSSLVRSSLSASASKMLLALIGRIDRSLDIEARFRRNLKVGTRRIIHPIVRAIELGRQHATDDGHALGGICTKVARAGGDDPNAELAPMALAGEGLDLGVEVRVVLDGHGWLLEMMVRNEVRMSWSCGC